MSHEATTWAFAQKQGDLTAMAKFLLVALANYADKYGVAYPGRAALAEDCACAVETVTRNMAVLEAAGLIARRQRRRRNGSRTSDWVVLAANLADRGPLSKAPEEDYPADVVSLTASKSPDSEPVGQVTQTGGPEPSEEPSVSPTARGREKKTTHGSQQTLDGSDAPSTQPKTARRKVDRKTVTLREEADAATILAIFNNVAGTKFRATEYKDKIVRRLREHPEVEVQEHEAIVKRNFDHAWWKGDPNPSVIYGNASIFEAAMHVKGEKSAARAGDFLAQINARRDRSLD